MPLAVTSPNGGEANQPAYAMLLHRADEVRSTSRENRGGLRATRAQRREHGFLSRHSSLHRIRIPARSPAAREVGSLGVQTAEGLRARAVTSWSCSSTFSNKIRPVPPVAPIIGTFTFLLRSPFCVSWFPASISFVALDLREAILGRGDPATELVRECLAYVRGDEG